MYPSVQDGSYDGKFSVIKGNPTGKVAIFLTYVVVTIEGFKKVKI